MADWFRSWHGAPTDPKWLLIAKRANVRPIHVTGTWWALLDHASQHPDRGCVDDFDVETFALFAGMEEANISRIIAELTAKRLIVGGRIAMWQKRQPKREDDSAERVRKHRDAKKPAKSEGNGGGGDDVKRNVTHGNARVDTDTDISVADATGAAAPMDLRAALFDTGIPYLTRHGSTDRNARSMLGRWRQIYGDAAVIDMLARAQTEAVSEPVSWLNRALETRYAKPKSTRPAAVEGFRDPVLRELARASAAAGMA